MNSIIFSCYRNLVEGIAPASGIQPGRFCRWHESSTPFVFEYEGGGGTDPDKITGMIAIEKSSVGKDIQDNYIDGENTFVVVVNSGDVVYCRTPTSYATGTVLGPNNITADGLLISGAIAYTDMCVSLSPGVNMGDGTYLTKIQIF